MWVLTIPKMLRVYFRNHRELLGELSRCAYETLKELMTAAAFEEKDSRPGMVSVVHPGANGCPCPISTITWQKSSFVIVSFGC